MVIKHGNGSEERKKVTRDRTDEFWRKETGKRIRKKKRKGPLKFEIYVFLINNRIIKGS